VEPIKEEEEEDIRTDLREIEWEAVDCMYIAQVMDHWWVLVTTVMNLRIP
jgi:hypothetical protein